ncbi:hypothetical protein LTR78_006846 [Recurvomyces mirabilis]|uniref:Conserved oligomeric Golgi complex subunit 8 n=1 Tax=Recurvomyces mirabilis TaxID=574656 RepID=A0AAE0WKB4_9PEZI|nr:hypothetical protein LTR78_006846 [Recurvomyces mirabilis]KAK5153163.1 hypothetical protein LTS14_007808 [Recurvomyces mirabilis]
MSDLYDLLAPYFDDHDPSSGTNPTTRDAQTTTYLNRLSTLSLGNLTTTEPASLLHAAQSHLRNLQALSKRSHKAVIASSSHLSNLTSLLPSLGSEAYELKDAVPQLESAAVDFARKYDRSTENEVLDRRKRAMLLSRNVDRVSDVLELPSLLSSTIQAAQAPSSSSAASSTTSYASALDLHAHIKRLSSLYPQSGLVAGISQQADAEIQNLTTILITSLQSPTLKLAGAMRTVGWLRRVAPDLADDEYSSSKATATSTKSVNFSSAATNSTGALCSLFLVCRLRTLNITLEALEPLRELADQETTRRLHSANGARSKQQPQSIALGNHSERYLKRYIEIFREQSFAIISMYKSIFPSGLPSPDLSATSSKVLDDPLLPLPSPLASFTNHLITKLTTTLRAYLPNITDPTSRESLLTQILYCAGSLGRLGADFGLMIALLGEDDGSAEHESQGGREDEWVQVMKKHRIQASRLEVLARGVGTGVRKRSAIDIPQAGDVVSPAA